MTAPHAAPAGADAAAVADRASSQSANGFQTVAMTCSGQAASATKAAFPAAPLAEPGGHNRESLGPGDDAGPSLAGRRTPRLSG
eukprot:15420771-Alexandrium_andersonii.AAC.1